MCPASPCWDSVWPPLLARSHNPGAGRRSSRQCCHVNFPPLVRNAVSPAAKCGAPRSRSSGDPLRVAAHRRSPRLDQCQLDRRGGGDHFPRGVPSPRGQSGVDSGRRSLQVLPAVVRGACASESLGTAPRRGSERIDTQATGQLHRVICLYGQHVPQSHGRRDRRSIIWPAGSEFRSTSWRSVEYW